MSRRLLGKLVVWFALLLVLAAFMLPLGWVVVGSLKSRGEFFTRPPVFIPKTWQFKNYPDALNHGVKKGLTDSLMVTTCSMLISIALGAPAAYAIARFQVGKERLAFWILSIRMFPPIVTILPLFMIYRQVHLVDTYIGLILAYTVFNLPFAIWLLKGFIQEIPIEIEEAAQIDGASMWQTFVRIILPLAAPGLIVAALFTFIFAWNDLPYGLIFGGSNVTPLPVIIAQFAGGHEILWGLISAAAVIAIIPVVLLTAFLQRYLTRGLTMGAIQ